MTRSVVQTEPAAESTIPDEAPILIFATGSGAADADAIRAAATTLAAVSIRFTYYNVVADLQQPCTKLTSTGPPTILFEVFWTQQKRKRLIEAALAGLDLPPEDYPFYVTIGADGPLTPTGLAELLDLPLSTVAFRVKRLERRGHAERIDNPADGRSFLVRLTQEGRSLLNKARPRFRSYAEAVEGRLGGPKTVALRESLIELRQAIDDELAVNPSAPAPRASSPASERRRA
jgi:DNA-binding MarR family transcriptional regulator